MINIFTRCKEWWQTSRAALITHDRLMKFWVLMIPVGYFLRNSIPYVVGISHYAIIATHWSSEEAAKEVDWSGERRHRWLKWGWIMIVPISWLLRHNTPWLVFLSQYALVVTHWNGKEGAKLEVKLEETEGDMNAIKEEYEEECGE